MMLSSRSMNLRRSLTWLVFCLYRERASAYSLMRTEDRKRHSLNFSSSRIRPEDDLVMADGQIGLTLTGVTNCQCGGEIRSDELNLRRGRDAFLSDFRKITVTWSRNAESQTTSHLTTCSCWPWLLSYTLILFFSRVISVSMLLVLPVTCCRSGLISEALATYSCHHM